MGVDAPQKRCFEKSILYCGFRVITVLGQILLRQTLNSFPVLQDRKKSGF